MINDFDTIAAIATAPGNSSIGIIRISGEQSFMVAEKILKLNNVNFSITPDFDHTVHYGFVYDEDELVDEVLFTVFFAPRSFTAENVVEINCHGGSFVTRKILSLVIKNGARIAEPGEFTKRAFLNGRIDLSQAEAVIDIINSKNDFSLRNAQAQLLDGVKKKIETVREKILEETAFIEAALDDPEHYDLDGHRDTLLLSCKEIVSRIENIIDRSGNASLLKNGIRTLIVGKPNAGKSSLLNILSGYERAIVTDIAGTTRDTIEESISLDGIILNLIDTAGIRSSSDEVERIGVNRALSMIDNVDLILYVIDLSIPIDENDKKIAESIKNKNTIVILNKSDIIDGKITSDIEKFASDVSEKRVVISAKSGEGIKDLRSVLVDMFMFSELNFDEEIYVTNERQLDCINRALSSMKLVTEGIMNGSSEDFLAIDLMDAYAFLGEVTGEQVSDDLADKIFSKFCMGK